MEQDMRIGMKGEISELVTPDNTAATFGDGLAPVYSTPTMIGLMETACAQLIQPLLPEGSSSVGILVNVRHLAASPIGQTIRAEAEIVGIEGRKVTFKVVAYDSVEKVGEGIHERAIIDMNKFMSRVSQKAGK